ncbi:MAG: MarR family winged helix-turn-helix transcriptional regulator [Desulfobacteraceae bacterium]|jgi:DNA-binding MarR family transcriptional regulator
MKYTDCIAFLLAKANQKSQSFLKKKLQPYGLTAVQHLILEVVVEHEGLTPGEISKRLVSDNATVSGVLERMEEHGWITRKNDPNDKRVSRIFPGKKVEELKEEILLEREKANEELLKHYSDEERVILKNMLNKFLQSIE